MAQNRTSPVGVGIVGYGYWGPNLARNFNAAEGFELRVVCDRSAERLAGAKRLYPTVRLVEDFDAVCASSDIDLVVIATPISSHFELAKKALASGKDVFVEKPLCTTSAEADTLAELAARNERRIFVDHTFVYNPAVRKMKEVVKGNGFGRPLYYDSVRANLGLFQSDINVLWDLAPHDLSILDYVLDGAVPTSVSCTGSAHFNGTQNIAYLNLMYSEGFIAHCHLSWLAPVKIRQVIFAGSGKFLIYNDNDQAERIKVYDKGVDMGRSEGERNQQRVQYRVGDIYAPFVSAEEALKIEVEQIASCYFDGADPLTGIVSGANMVRILEAAQRSLDAGGTPQTIEQPHALLKAR